MYVSTAHQPADLVVVEERRRISVEVCGVTPPDAHHFSRGREAFPLVEAQGRVAALEDLQFFSRRR